MYTAGTTNSVNSVPIDKAGGDHQAHAKREAAPAPLSR
jgi:hypothetical protein